MVESTCHSASGMPLYDAECARRAMTEVMSSVA